MLQAFCVGRHDRWDTHIPSLRFAINSAVHETTGLAPAELTFGQNIASPLENSLREEKSSEDFNYSQYLVNLRKQLKLLRLEMEPTVEKSKKRQARNYNKKRRFVSFKPGDLVYTREHHQSNAADKVSGKLADRWGGPYVVIELRGGVNLVVEDIGNGENRHTVHVCNVKPCVERRSDQKTDEGAPETAADSSDGEEPSLHHYNLRPRVQ
ncbi:hypothetical protein B566_EDAN002040 [Ephemera danica]|nr:hypothetical protein B566_EDAN002040 [Ephemera danica]